MVGVLTEQSWQEQDRRYWEFSREAALKAGEDPFEAYNELRQSVEMAMSPAEPIPEHRRGWYEN